MLQLLPERGHKDPEGGNVVVPAASPDLLGNIGVGEDLSHVLGQEAEQLIFDGSKVELIFSQIGTAGGIVNPQLPVREQGAGGLLLPGHQPVYGATGPG